jgi:putative endonuclease
MSREKGKFAEDRAVEFLKERGFEIVDRNFHSRFGEIDIIAKSDEALHFVEVKSGIWDPISQITSKKLSKIVKTAEIYMQKKRINSDFRFDAVILNENDIEYIENITLF